MHDFANNIPPTPLKNICMMTVGGKSLTRFNRIYQMKLPMFCIPSYNINHRRVWSRKTFMYKLYSMGPQWCSPLSQFWKVQVTISENKRPYTLFLDVFTVCLRCINCFRRKKGQTKESYNFFLTHLHLHNPHREQLGLWTAVCCVLSASLTVTATVITIAQEPTEKEKKKAMGKTELHRWQFLFTLHIKTFTCAPSPQVTEDWVGKFPFLCFLWVLQVF